MQPDTYKHLNVKNPAFQEAGFSSKCMNEDKECSFPAFQFEPASPSVTSPRLKLLRCLGECCRILWCLSWSYQWPVRKCRAVRLSSASEKSL